MSDRRSALQRSLDELIGPPLYYCDECKLAVKVTETGIERPCDCNAQIIAPRKAIVHGVGGMNMSGKVTMTIAKLGAAITGRCV
jgi:hypothetical protein